MTDPYHAIPDADPGTVTRARPIIYLAHIGEYMPPAVRDAADRALAYANEHGYTTIGHSLHDLTIWRRLGIAHMRNSALMISQMTYNADYAVILDNDVILPEDALYRMAEQSKAILIPVADHSEYLPEGVLPPKTTEPDFAANQGCNKVGWGIASCMMFSKAALHALLPTVFCEVNKIANIEDYDCMRWRWQGCDTWLDTDLPVKLTRPPSPRHVAEDFGARKQPHERIPPIDGKVVIPLLLVGLGRTGTKVLGITSSRYPLYGVTAVADDNVDLQGTDWNGKTVQPIDGGLRSLFDTDPNMRAVCGIGDTKKRHAVWERLWEYGFEKDKQPTICHDDGQRIGGVGNLVCQDTRFQPNCHIGDYNTFNVGAVVGPEASVGNFVTVNGQTFICGGAKVEDFAYIGVGAKVLPEVTVREGTVVGAGAVVTRDTEPWTTVAGVPAQKIDGP